MVATQPGGVNWATAGGGSTPHFIAEMLREAGMHITIVPTEGAEGVTAVFANNVPATSEADRISCRRSRAASEGHLHESGSPRTTRCPPRREQGFPPASKSDIGGR